MRGLEHQMKQRFGWVRRVDSWASSQLKALVARTLIGFRLLATALNLQELAIRFVPPIWLWAPSSDRFAGERLMVLRSSCG